MNLLDRFSTHLRDVLAKSIRLATELKHPQVEPLHLFFCLTSQKGSVASEILHRFHINPKTIERLLFAIPGARIDSQNPTKPSFSDPIALLSPAAKATLEKALLIAEENEHNYIGTEHLLSSTLRLKDPSIMNILEASDVRVPEFEKQLDTVLSNATQFPHITEAAELAKRIQDNVNDTSGDNLGSLDIPEPPPFTDQQPTAKDKRKQNALDFFATNLTNENAQKTIDPVIGRDTEIERLIHILCRRTKNNPILLGDPGVGKTAIVEGLAKKILSGDVPDLLLNKKIYALDLGMLIAGTIYRGEFEARLRQVIEEVLNNPDIILFIDELHNIVGTGSNQGTMDAANILKPALARGHIRCIGATTPGEFKKYIESDPALERRFQPIFVKEPSLTDTVKIIQGIKINYEAYHNVHITDEAIVAAVELSDRYISNKFLPDKAIDVIDETAAAKRLTVKMQPWQNKLVRTKQKLEKIILAKEQAAAQDKFSEAVKLKDEEEKLRSEIKKIEKASTTKKIKAAAHVDVQDIYQQIAKITGVSPTELLLDKPEQFDVLTQKLKEYIVGQDTVIETVARLIRQAQLGLSHPERPLASFLFVGESGVGKTELAKTLAKLLYPGSDALIKLDMSEFNESFGVSKLLGSPAGYIGYKESNQFTDRIKMNPHCIILFDEIDKAHRDVIKLLLQILENGEITDSTGRKISLKHAIIIMTTSLGAEDVKRGIIGFSERDTHALTPELVSQLTEKLKDHFSPEVINRIDRICIFNPLSHDQLIKLAELELVKFNERLKNHHTSLEAQPDIFEWFIKQLPEKQRGARDIRRLVREKSENLIADLILKRKIKPHYELVVKDNELSLK